MRLSFVCILLFPMFAAAITSTTVLPSGINSPSFRYGTVQGIDQKYTENGSLMRLGDYKSVVFDSTQLSKFSPDAKKLIDALNRFGSQKLGDSFNLGVLKIETAPQVKYFAPVFARGLSDRWTVGIGLPIVNYKNNIKLSQQFSNIDYYREQFAGIDPELDAALNTDLGAATNQTLAAKGYRPLSSRDETFLGDAQLMSLFKFYDDRVSAFSFQAQFNLPTGPQYNPDDLAAVNTFGRTIVTNTLAYSRRLSGRFTVIPFASYVVNVPDRVSMRVPTSETDNLPEVSSKETLDRKLGNTATVGGSVVYEVNDEIALAGGYEASQKDVDTYAGRQGRRYDLLAANTAARYQKATVEATYSSVKSYFDKKSMLPAMLSLQVSDVVAGVNIERQIVQELNVMLFF